MHTSHFAILKSISPLLSACNLLSSFSDLRTTRAATAEVAVVSISPCWLAPKPGQIFPRLDSRLKNVRDAGSFPRESHCACVRGFEVRLKVKLFLLGGAPRESPK